MVFGAVLTSRRPVCTHSFPVLSKQPGLSLPPVAIQAGCSDPEYPYDLLALPPFLQFLVSATGPADVPVELHRVFLCPSLLGTHDRLVCWHTINFESSCPCSLGSGEGGHGEQPCLQSHALSLFGCSCTYSVDFAACRSPAPSLKSAQIHKLSRLPQQPCSCVGTSI